MCGAIFSFKICVRPSRMVLPEFDINFFQNFRQLLSGFLRIYRFFFAYFDFFSDIKRAQYQKKVYKKSSNCFAFSAETRERNEIKHL